jgi:hypothetical protein
VVSVKVSFNPAGVATSTGTMAGGQTPLLIGANQPHPMAVLLFGKRPAPLVDKRRFPKLAKALRKLKHLRGQIGELVGLGDDDGDGGVDLSQGSNASIGRDGRIRFGVELLDEREDDDDFLVAVIGHEVGHQPWSWPSFNLAGMTKKQLDAMYREEEAKADRFAGRALAELGADPESACAFLINAERFEAHKPSDYYPAEVRAEMIRDAFSRRLRALKKPKLVLPGMTGRSRGRDLR